MFALRWQEFVWSLNNFSALVEFANELEIVRAGHYVRDTRVIAYVLPVERPQVSGVKQTYRTAVQLICFYIILLKTEVSSFLLIYITRLYGPRTCEKN